MCGCVTGKSEEKPAPEASVTSEIKSDKTDPEKPWNRQSLQVYCGDAKKKPTAEQTDPNKSPKQNENNTHPGGTENQKPEVTLGPNTYEANTSQNKAEKNCLEKFNTIKDSEENQMNNTAPMIESSNKSLPSIVEESGDTTISGKLHQPPLIAPFNPSAYKVIKRPRSLDAWENKKPMHRSRPLSYSPGLRKTVHPKSLHSINVSVSPQKDRPKSMDVESVLDSKGFDSFKLRRIMTQKHYKKGHEENKVGLIKLSCFSSLFAWIKCCSRQCRMKIGLSKICCQILDLHCQIFER